MRTRLVLRVACLVLVTATLASAQSAGPPTYAVGDYWITTLGETRVVKVDENTVSMVRTTQCPTCTFVYDKELTLLPEVKSTIKFETSNRNVREWELVSYGPKR